MGFCQELRRGLPKFSDHGFSLQTFQWVLNRIEIKRPFVRAREEAIVSLDGIFATLLVPVEMVHPNQPPFPRAERKQCIELLTQR
jgi:hypothetical protein